MIVDQQEVPIDFQTDVYRILLLKAEETHTSISEVVNEALHWYFSGQSTPLLSQYSQQFIQEARRQSRLVSQSLDPSCDIWETNLDTSDWRN